MVEICLGGLLTFNVIFISFRNSSLFLVTIISYSQGPSDMWRCPVKIGLVYLVKGYSLLDQMSSRNMSTSSVEYVNVL